MKQYQLVSRVSGCCMLLAGVLVVVPLITNNWVILSINIKVGPSKSSNITKLFASLSNWGGNLIPNMATLLVNHSVNIDISFGLKKCCFYYNVQGLQTMVNNIMPTFPCKKYTWIFNTFLPKIYKFNMFDEEDKKDLKGRFFFFLFYVWLTFYRHAHFTLKHHRESFTLCVIALLYGTCQPLKELFSTYYLQIDGLNCIMMNALLQRMVL